MEPQQHPQTGNLPVLPNISDFMQGGETGIEYVVNLESGDWRTYEPTNEDQSIPFVFDTMSCTSFSYNNDREMEFKRKIETGNINPAFLEFLHQYGYFDDNGNINFSDKWLAIMSGTTKQGNNYLAVADTAKKVGLIPERMLKNWNGETTWEQWHNPMQITEEMKACGKLFLQYCDMPYEWTFYDGDPGLSDGAVQAIQKGLKQSPLWFAIPFPGTHSVAGVFMDDNRKRYYVYDTYPPYNEKKDWGDPIHYAMKVVIVEKSIKPDPEPVDFPYFKRVIKYGVTGSDVMALQRILAELGYFIAKPTGNAYNVTVASIKRFQAANGLIVDGIAGPRTFEVLRVRYTAFKLKPHTSDAGIALIKQFEGLHDGNTATPILEPKKDPVGLYTLGWGSRYDLSGKMVTAQTSPITLEQAEILLKRDLKIFEDAVNVFVTAALTQQQFDALVSLSYNIGVGAFRESTVLKNVNLGKVTRSDFTAYVKALDSKTGKLVTLLGLVARRNKEADLFGV